jgi:hypothetical protein
MGREKKWKFDVPDKVKRDGFALCIKNTEDADNTISTMIYRWREYSKKKQSKYPHLTSPRGRGIFRACI